MLQILFNPVPTRLCHVITGVLAYLVGIRSIYNHSVSNSKLKITLKKGGADGFAKMSNEDKKRFLAAVTGLGGKIDGKAAAALIAAAASGGDAEIANKIIEKMMFGLGDEIDPSMMAALMATTALVARGASNEEVREYCLSYNHQTFLFELLIAYRTITKPFYLNCCF